MSKMNPLSRTQRIKNTLLFTGFCALCIIICANDLAYGIHLVPLFTCMCAAFIHLFGIFFRFAHERRAVLTFNILSVLILMISVAGIAVHFHTGSTPVQPVVMTLLTLAGLFTRKSPAPLRTGEI